MRFQSTPSPRRATKGFALTTWKGAHFNPRPPRGGRPSFEEARSLPTDLFQSTPSPRRATARTVEAVTIVTGFQSTPSPRRATQAGCYGDVPQGYFNPRPPRGGRLGIGTNYKRDKHFNPRPPRGGRRIPASDRWSPVPISIHALPAEGDGDHPRRGGRHRRISIHALPAEGDLF